jgi:hypothetical protein
VVEPLVIIELREQVLAREIELSGLESALVARENSVVEAELVLGRTRMECDATHDQAGAIQ